ncbi:MAG: redoxin domain-containing protein [Chloroflexi bacterium]|nr:redoxin domain-containing protein [Chloroflexota bacterium]
MQESADALRRQANVYVINSDAPEDSQRLKQITRIGVPVLLDRQLAVARQYDFLPKPGQPMGDMIGVAQMGFVIVDGGGIIRVQRADVYFGRHAGQMLEILRILGERAAAGRRAEDALAEVGAWSERR